MYGLDILQREGLHPVLAQNESRHSLIETHPQAVAGEQRVEHLMPRKAIGGSQLHPGLPLEAQQPLILQAYEIAYLLVSAHDRDVRVLHRQRRQEGWRRSSPTLPIEMVQAAFTAPAAGPHPTGLILVEGLDPVRVQTVSHVVGYPGLAIVATDTRVGGCPQQALCIHQQVIHTHRGQPVCRAEPGIASGHQVPAHQTALATSPQIVALERQGEHKVVVAIAGPARRALGLCRRHRLAFLAGRRLHLADAGGRGLRLDHCSGRRLSPGEG